MTHILSRIHLDSLRDTISWECVVMDDVVRSRLIELKSFLFSKFDIDPLQCFDVSSMLYACIVQDAVLPCRSCQDPYGFCPWDPQT